MPRLVILALAASLLAAAPAHAGFYPGEPLDAGPEILSVSDLDVARDGSGAVAYLKLDGGVPHVYVSRLVAGVWQAPERIDGGLIAPSAEPVVAAGEDGRAAVAFVNAGTLYATVRGAGQGSWPAAAAVAGPAQAPSADMSINGVAYLTWTADGDIRAARAERTGTTFVPLAAPLDVDPAARAGEGDGRSRVAVAADGVALVTWGEGGRLHARRLFEHRLSVAPQRIDVDSFGGQAAGGATSHDVDIEDDSSFAWVVFRQAVGGRTLALARRLRGSLFDDPVNVGGDATGPVRIDLNGRGEGFAASVSAGAPTVASLQLDEFAPAETLFGPAPDVAPAPAAAEGGDAVIAYLTAGGGVIARRYDNGKPAGDAALTREAEAADTAAGFDAASNRAGDVVAVWVQGRGADRKLVSGAYDRAPGAFSGTTSTGWRAQRRPRLSWGASFELWGEPTYGVVVDGIPVGTTRATQLVPTADIPDGVHRWSVLASDRRGQTARSRTRELRVDATPPLAAVRFTGTRRAGRTLTLFSGAQDATSGVKSVVWSFGDRTRSVAGSTVKHVFRRGTFTVTVTVTDRAGNRTVAERRIQIAKAPKRKK